MDVEHAHLAPRADRSAILVTTGSFSPVHHGHIAMMEAARSAVETHGWRVRGGYFSPSHDDYVGGKYGGDAAMVADRRIELLRGAITEHRWLAVDEWEAAQSRSVGHYRVIDRLEAAGLADRVYYVCGADRAGFVHSSAVRGHCCVCVERADVDVEPYRGYAEGDRILFAPSTAHAHASSTAIRAGVHDHLPESIQALYLAARGDRPRRRGRHEV